MGTSKSGLYLNTKGSKRTVSEYALVHSNEGTFMNVGKDRQKNSFFRLFSGGHGEDNIRLLQKYGISIQIVKIFSNGVRVGNVDGHKDLKKREQNGQTWFPKDWTKKDIIRAGEHVGSLKKNKHVPDGVAFFGTWKGVRVGVKRDKGKIATIFPDSKQYKIKGVK